MFGLLYFVQGIAEPTEGLIAQPVRSLLRGQGYSVSEIGAFMALLAAPWSMKPLFGLVSDFVPIFGMRRRSWLLLCTFATAAGLFAVWAYAPHSRFALLVALLVPTCGVAFSDVVVDALMVETGRPLGLTGRLQSVQWAAMYGATILAGTLGGSLSQWGREDIGFLVCAAVTLVSLVVALTSVREPARSSDLPLRALSNELWRTVRSPAVVGVATFLFLWNFNPFCTSVLYLHMTEVLGLSDQWYGHSVSVLAAASIAACVIYARWLSRLALPALLHISIVTGILATLAYLTMVDERTAILASAAVGLTYMTATLVQLDLAARACSPTVAATVFAALMAISNLSLSLSEAVGTQLYEWGVPRFGAHTTFQALIVLGTLCTSGCWLLVPTLRRAQEP